MKSLLSFIKSMCFIQQLCAAIIFTIIFFIFLDVFVKAKIGENEKPKVSHKDWGVVTLVNNCRTSKYSLYCNVETNLFTFNQIDVTNFPNKYINVGDKIGKQLLVYKEFTQTSYTQNNLAMQISRCNYWESCFNKYN
jgi:hypothetical protein